MQTILGDPTKIEAVDAEIKSSSAPAVTQVNWLALIEGLYAVLLLLLPVFFLPVSADLLSLNKSYLTILVSLLSLALFFVHAVQRGRTSISNVTTYLGLSAFVFAGVVSAFFSLNKNGSIFGHFGNYSDSLLFIISVFLIGFVASNVKLNVRKLFQFFLAGVTLSTLVSFYVLYGQSIPGFGMLPRVFSFAGSVYVLMGLQLVVVIGSLFTLINSTTFKGRVFYTTAILINALYLLTILNGAALAVLGLGLLFLFLYVQKEIPAKNKTLIIGVLIALGVLAFVNHYPMTRDALGLRDMNTQPRLPLNESWMITAETLRDRPIYGSGIGTFVNTFSLYRPASLNQTENWQARFETPYSDVLLWVGAAGLLGLLAYIGFVVYSIYIVKSLGKVDGVSKLLTLVITVSLLTLVILGSNPVIYVLLFMALGAAIHKTERNPINITSVPALSVITVIVLATMGYVLFNAYRVYAGQHYFRESLMKENLGERFQLQAAAINADPSESVYQRAYISTGVAISTVLAQKQDLTDSEKQQIIDILTQSFNNIRYVTETFEPFNVANWALRGDLYASVIDVAEGADAMAVQAYRNAIQLERSNPTLWINLGSVYYRRQVYAEAISAFLQAVQLKEDDANARYNLAYALKDAGYLQDAVTQMEVALRLVGEGTPDHEKASKDLEEFKKLLADATAKQAAAQSPEGVEGLNNEPGAQGTSEGPLVAPEDQPQPQLESTDPAVQEGVEGIVENDDELQPADGSEVPEDGTEAPIANPQGE